MKKIKILFTLLLTTFLFSCNDDEEGIIQNPPQDFSYNQGNTVSRNFHGLILDTSGNPVSNAMVSIGSTSVQTNSNG